MATARTAPRVIAVTGATGWIGSRLCAAAERRGVAVRRVARAALASPDACRRALEGCDAVVHLAALVHQSGDSTPRARYTQVNERLTSTLAQAAGAAAVRRFLFVSSAKVLGDRSSRPALESDPARPADAYAASKLAAENLLASAARDRMFELVIVRPPLVWGPGVRANFLSLLRLADSPWPLPLAGARAPRSMVYIDNLIDALLFLCESPHAPGRTFYVGDEADVSVEQLLRDFRRRLGRAERLFAVPVPVLRWGLRAASALRRSLSGTYERMFEPLQVDASALREIGWRAPVGFEVALDETMNWYRTQ